MEDLDAPSLSLVRESKAVIMYSAVHPLTVRCNSERTATEKLSRLNSGSKAEVKAEQERRAMLPKIDRGAEILRLTARSQWRWRRALNLDDAMIQAKKLVKGEEGLSIW